MDDKKYLSKFYKKHFCIFWNVTTFNIAGWLEYKLLLSSYVNSTCPKMVKSKWSTNLVGSDHHQYYPLNNFLTFRGPLIGQSKQCDRIFKQLTFRNVLSPLLCTNSPFWDFWSILNIKITPVDAFRSVNVHKEVVTCKSWMCTIICPHAVLFSWTAKILLDNVQIREME